MQLELMCCCGVAEEGQNECGMASSGSSAQGGQGEGWGHSGTLPWHGSTALATTLFFHLPVGWAEHALCFCAVPPSSAQANERKQVFQGGDPIYVHLMLHYTGIS